MKKAGILTIGSEILIGQIIDTNSSYLGQELTHQDIEVVEIKSIADNKEDILNALNEMSKRVDLLLITGGLGPTKDDITKQVLADFTEDTLVFDKDLHSSIVNAFKKRNIPISASHKQQCFMPSKAKKLTNNKGTAPGMLFEHKGLKIISMPGVPYEMKDIFINEVKPMLQVQKRTSFYHRTIHTCGKPESWIEEQIEKRKELTLKEIDIAYLPSIGRVRIRLSAKGADQTSTKERVDNAVRIVCEALGDIVYGFEETSLVKEIQKMMIAKKLTLATAESCTGGRVASDIVSVAGSSQYFEGGIIAYSNKIKRNELEVEEITLKEFGAVSIETTEQMVKGIIKKYGVDIGVAVSGIAGPGGGSEEKPVGTVCISCGNGDQIISKKYLFRKQRDLNIEYSKSYALIMLRKFLLGQ